MRSYNPEFRSKLSCIANAMRWALAALAATAGCGIGISHAALPAGLDSRANIAAYLDAALPTTTAGSMPSLLSQTGTYSNLLARTPHAGLIPYAGNSALWTDGSLKSRYIGLPFDGTAGAPKIGFTTSGAWTFPNGTVFVKNFDLVVDERVGAANPIRRLETRILVRLSTGGLRGATYKWRLDNSDADIIPNALNETVTITQANSTTRSQTWAYPSPGQCLICHNTDAGMVLGVKTAQQNSDYTYPATGRTDNQLHTFHHLGMFDQAIADPPSSYARMVDVLDTSATMEDRVKSYQDANCSHCHRPDGTRPNSATGPLFDMRYDTPILAPVGAGRIPIVANSGSDGLVRRDIPNSSIHDRDGRVGFRQMPPLARNVPDQRILALYDQWVNYAYDVLSVTRLTRNSVRLKFNRAVDAVTANVPSNYAFTGGVTVSQSVQGADLSEVVLTTSTLAANTSYTVTVNRVEEAQAPQNPIWPNTQFQFTTPSTTVPGVPTITIGAAGNGQITLSFTAPDSDGGSPITGHIASCTPGTNTATGVGSPLTVTALNNGTQYTCNVRAINVIGTGGASSAVMLTPNAVVPDPPTSVSAVRGNASAIITFVAPANNGGASITGYSAISAQSGITGSCVAPCTSIGVTGLNNGTAYTFTVTATNAIGNSAPSAASNSVTPATLPGAPTISAATAGNASATITFTAPASNGGAAITTYTANSAPSGITGSCVAPCTSIGVTGLNNGTAYTFTVTATNAIGNSAQSAVSNSVTPATFPGAPTIGAATASNASATITFTAPASNGGAAISGYTAISTPSGITGSCVAPCTSIGVTGLNNGTAYTFTVTATNAIGTSAPSAVSNSVTPATLPGAPIIGVATPGDGLATVSFTAPTFNGGSAITSYTLRCVGPNTVTASGSGPPLTATGMTNGASYACNVFAINAAGNSPDSGTVNVTPSALPPLALASVASRKTHGAAGTFGVTINPLTIPTGLVDVEPRIIGAGHTLVFSFNIPITAVGAVSTTAGSAVSVASGNDVIVTLTAVPDNRRVTVTLTSVNSVPTPFAASMGFLIGDVNTTRSVTASDISGVKARSGQTTTDLNFRFDVNATGAISASDISAVKARSGLTLPP